MNDLQAAASVLVENNTLYSNTGHKVGGIGIFDALTSNIILSANTIRNNAESGIGVFNSSLFNITNNLIVSNGLDDLYEDGEHYASGIQLQNVSFLNNDISGNTIRNNKYVGISVYAMDGTVGPNNILVYNGNGGEQGCSLVWGPGSGDGAVAVRDLASGSAVDIEGNVITDNSIGLVSRRDCVGTVRLDGSSVECNPTQTYWSKANAIIYVAQDGTVYKNSGKIKDPANPQIIDCAADGLIPNPITGGTAQRCWGMLIDGKAKGITVKNCEIRNTNPSQNNLGPATPAWPSGSPMGGGLFVGPAVEAWIYSNDIHDNGYRTPPEGEGGSVGVVMRCSGYDASLYNNTIYANDGDGLDIKGGGAVIGYAGNGNAIYDNGRNGVGCAGGGSAIVQYNDIYGNQGEAGVGFVEDSQAYVYNNSIHNNSGVGVGFGKGVVAENGNLGNQAGFLNKVVLSGNASDINDAYQGMDLILDSSSTANPQTVTITAYDGTTKVATLGQNFSTTPMRNDLYNIGLTQQKKRTWDQTTVLNEIVLKSDASDVNDYYNGMVLIIENNSIASPKTVLIEDYIGSTRTAMIDRELLVQPEKDDWCYFYDGLLGNQSNILNQVVLNGVNGADDAYNGMVLVLQQSSVESPRAVTIQDYTASNKVANISPGFEIMTLNSNPQFDIYDAGYTGNATLANNTIYNNGCNKDACGVGAYRVVGARMTIENNLIYNHNKQAIGIKDSNFAEPGGIVITGNDIYSNKIAIRFKNNSGPINIVNGNDMYDNTDPKEPALEFKDNDSDINISGNIRIVGGRSHFKNNKNVTVSNNQQIIIEDSIKFRDSGNIYFDNNTQFVISGDHGEFRCDGNKSISISDNGIFSVKNIRFGTGDAGQAMPNADISILDNGTLLVPGELKCKFNDGELSINNNGLIGGGAIGKLRIKNNPHAVHFSGNDIAITGEWRMEENGNIYILDNIGPITGGDRYAIEFKEMEDVFIQGNTFMNMLQFKKSHNATISGNMFYDTVEFKECDFPGTTQVFANNTITNPQQEEAGLRIKKNNHLIVENNVIYNCPSYGIEFKELVLQGVGGVSEFLNNHIYSCHKNAIRTEDVTGGIILRGNTIENCGTGGSGSDPGTEDGADYYGIKMKNTEIVAMTGNTFNNNYWAGLGLDNAWGDIGGTAGNENVFVNNGTLTLTEAQQGGNAGLAVDNIAAGESLTIAGNIIYSNYSDGMGFDNTSNTLIIGGITGRVNTIYGNKRAGIGIDGFTGTLTMKDNVILSNTFAGVQIRNSDLANLTFEDNQIRSNIFTGLALNNTTGTFGPNNTFKNNGRASAQLCTGLKGPGSGAGAIAIKNLASGTVNIDGNVIEDNYMSSVSRRECTGGTVILNGQTKNCDQGYWDDTQSVAYITNSNTTINCGGGSINGGDVWGVAITKGATNVTVTNCVIENNMLNSNDTGPDGTPLGGGLLIGPGVDAYVHNNTFKNNGYQAAASGYGGSAGIVLRCNDAATEIWDNWIYSNKSDGIDFLDGEATIGRSGGANNIYGNGRAGIALKKSVATIQFNSIRNNTDNGILVADNSAGQNVTISGNVIGGADGAGNTLGGISIGVHDETSNDGTIYIDDSSGTPNTISYNQRSGISFTVANNVSIQNNFIVSNGQENYTVGDQDASGIRARDSVFGRVSGNTIRHNLFAGIASYGTPGTIGPNNTIRYDGDPGATGGGGGGIEGCVTEAGGGGDVRGGILVRGLSQGEEVAVLCANTITSNYNMEIAKTGPGTVSSCGNAVVTGNFFATRDDAFMYFDASTQYTNLNCASPDPLLLAEQQVSLPTPTIDATNEKFGIIIVGNGTAPTITNCTIKNAAMNVQSRATIDNNGEVKYIGAGIFIGNNATPSLANNYIFSNGWGLLDDRIYTEAGASGLQLRCMGENASIVNNIIASNKNDGLVGRQTGGLIGVVNLGNTFRNNGRGGIGIYEGTNRNLEIAYNAIHNNKRGIGAIDFDGTMFTISNNFIYSNQGNTTISGSGIGLNNLIGNVEIEANTIRNNEYGIGYIGAQGSSQVTISQNVIYSNTVIGIGFGDGSAAYSGYTWIHSNEIHHNQGNGIPATGAAGIGGDDVNGATISISNNTIYSNIQNVRSSIGFLNSIVGNTLNLTVENNNFLDYQAGKYAIETKQYIGNYLISGNTSYTAFRFLRENAYFTDGQFLTVEIKDNPLLAGLSSHPLMGGTIEVQLLPGDEVIVDGNTFDGLGHPDADNAIKGMADLSGQTLTMTILNNVMKRFDRYGIEIGFIHSGKKVSGSIGNNQIYSNSEGGISINRPIDMSIDNNRIWSVSNYGISMYAPESWVVLNNNIVSAAGSGVVGPPPHGGIVANLSSTPVDLTIYSNRVWGVDGQGIGVVDIYAGSTVTISNNTVGNEGRGNTGQGIGIGLDSAGANAGSVSVSDNLIAYNEKSGIGFTASNGNISIVNNIVLNNTNSTTGAGGIGFRDLSGTVVIKDNIIASNEGFDAPGGIGFNMTTNASISVTNNSIRNNTYGGGNLSIASGLGGQYMVAGDIYLYNNIINENNRGGFARGQLGILTGTTDVKIVSNYIGGGSATGKFAAVFEGQIFPPNVPITTFLNSFIFSGNEIDCNGKNDGLKAKYAKSFTVTGNKVHNFYKTGIMISPNWKEEQPSLIEGNEVYSSNDTDSYAIRVKQPTKRLTIKDNTTRNAWHGIAVWNRQNSSTDYTLIASNRSYNNERSGIQVKGSNHVSAGVTVRNNVVYSNEVSGIQARDIVSLEISSNHVWSNGLGIGGITEENQSFLDYGAVSSVYVKLDDSSSSTNDYYNKSFIYIDSGVGSPSVVEITDYTGSTNVAKITPKWMTQPSPGDLYHILRDRDAAIRVQSGDHPFNRNSANIHDNNVHDNNGFGVAMADFNNNESAILSNNTITSNSLSGIAIGVFDDSDNQGTFLIGDSSNPNTIRNNLRSGISFIVSNDVTIQNNLIVSNGLDDIVENGLHDASGIQARDSVFALISDNTIRNNKFTGIASLNTDGTIGPNNIIQYNGNASGGEAVDCSGVTVGLGSGDGAVSVRDLDAGDYLIVTGNVIENNSINSVARKDCLGTVSLNNKEINCANGGGYWDETDAVVYVTEDNTVVSNQTITGGSVWGVAVKSGVTGVTIKNCVIENNMLSTNQHGPDNTSMGGGIFLGPGVEAQIYSNTIQSNGAEVATTGYGGNSGIVMRCSDANTSVWNNTISNNASDGINIKGGTVTIGGATPSHSNYVHNNGRHGLGFGGDAAAIVQYNDITDNTQQGIGVAGTASPTIKNNDIYSNNGYAGIGLTEQSSAYIYSNRIYDNAGVGVGFGDGSPIFNGTAKIDKNTIYNNQGDQGAAYAAGGIGGKNISAGQIEITNNYIYSHIGTPTTPKSGISFKDCTFNGALSISNNNIVSNSAGSVNLNGSTIAGDIYVLGNTLRNGMKLRSNNGGDITIDNNDIYGYGINDSDPLIGAVYVSIIAKDNDRLVINNNDFDGEGEVLQGIMTKCTPAHNGFEISGNTIKNYLKNGIIGGWAHGAAQSFKGSINDNVIRSNNWRGIALVNALDVSIYNNEIHHNGSGTSLPPATVYDCTGCHSMRGPGDGPDVGAPDAGIAIGISGHASVSVNIYGNEIYANDGYGIALADQTTGESITVSGNTIGGGVGLGNSLGGIVIAESSLTSNKGKFYIDSSYGPNIISYNNWSGISFSLANNVNIENNIIVSNGLDDAGYYAQYSVYNASGIRAKESSFVNISGNTIRYNRFSGIAARDTDGTIGPNNVIRYNGIEGSSGGTGGSLENCVQTSGLGGTPPRGGIMVSNLGVGEEVAVDCANNITDNYDVDIAKKAGNGTVTSCGNAVVTGQFFADASDTNYWYDGSSGTVVHDCANTTINAAGNAFGIIILDSDSDVTVQNCTIKNAAMDNDSRVTTGDGNIIGAGIFISNNATPLIRNNYIVSNGWALLDDRIYTEAGASGIMMRCADEQTSIVNNIIASNANDGLVGRESGGLIGLVNEGNIFRNNARNGIGLYESTTRNLSIAYNELLSNMRGIGANTFTGDLFTISNNTIANNTRSGISFTLSNGISIQDNIIVSNGLDDFIGGSLRDASGIRGMDSTFGNVTGNTLRNNRFSGICSYNTDGTIGPNNEITFNGNSNEVGCTGLNGPGNGDGGIAVRELDTDDLLVITGNVIENNYLGTVTRSDCTNGTVELDGTDINCDGRGDYWTVADAKLYVDSNGDVYWNGSKKRTADPVIDCSTDDDITGNAPFDITGGSAWGVAVDGGATGVTIRNCEIYNNNQNCNTKGPGPNDNMGGGVFVGPNAEVDIYGNVIRNNGCQTPGVGKGGSAGLVMRCAGNNTTLRNNDIHDNKGDGVDIKGGGGIVGIIGESNSIHHNLRHGIGFAGNATAIAQYNDIYLNKMQGVGVQESASPTVQNNIIRNNQGNAGVGIIDDSSPYIYNNSIRNNDGIGVGFGDGQTVRSSSLPTQGVLGNNQVKLDSNASGTNGYYTGMLFSLSSGTGDPAAALIIDYVGSSRIATLDQDWVTPPTQNDDYAIYNVGYTGNAVVDNNVIHDNGCPDKTCGVGAYKVVDGDITISNNEIYGHDDIAIGMKSSSFAEPNGIVIMGNEIHLNKKGILFQNNSGPINIINGNDIYDNDSEQGESLNFKDNASDVNIYSNYRIVGSRFNFKNNQNVLINNNQKFVVTRNEGIRCKNNWSISISYNDVVSVSSMRFGEETSGVAEPNMAVSINSNGTLKISNELKCKFTAGAVSINYNGLIEQGTIENLRIKNNSESLSFSYNDVVITKECRFNENGNLLFIDNLGPIGGNDRLSVEFRLMEDVDIHGNYFTSQVQFRDAKNVSITNNIFDDTVQFKECNVAGTTQVFKNNTIRNVNDHGFKTKASNRLIVEGNEIYNCNGYGVEFKESEGGESQGVAKFINNYIHDCERNALQTENVEAGIILSGNTIENCGTNGGGSPDQDYYGIKMSGTEIVEMSGNTFNNNYWAGIGLNDCWGFIGGPPGRENIFVNNGTMLLSDDDGGNAGLVIKSIDSGQLVIAGNIMYSNYTDGLAIKDTNNLVAIGAQGRVNKFYRNGRHGIALRPNNQVSAIPIIEYCEIYSNQNNGIGIRTNGDAIIRYNQIYGNSNSGIGFVGNGLATRIEKNLIYGNKDGIGFLKDQGDSGDQLLVKNNIIYENTDGGIKLEEFSSGDLLLYFNTIVDNGSFGIYDMSDNIGGDVTIKSTILWGNSDDINKDRSWGSLSVTYSDIEEGWSGTGNISSDPSFVNAGNDDYHIQSGSQVRNAGAATSPGVDDDIDDGTRPYDTSYDIGADEEGAIAPVDTVTVSGLADSNANVTQGTEDQGTLRFSLASGTASLNEVIIVPTSNCTASYPDDYYNIRLYRDEGSSDGEYDSGDTFLGNFYQNGGLFEAQGIINETIDTGGSDYLVVVDIPANANVGYDIEFRINDTNSSIRANSPDVVSTPYLTTSALYSITQAYTWYHGCSAGTDKVTAIDSRNFPEESKTENCNKTDGNRDDRNNYHWIRYRIGDGNQDKTVEKVRIYGDPTNPSESRIVNIYLHENEGSKGTIDGTLSIGTREGYFTTGSLTEATVNYITIELTDSLPKEMIMELEYATYGGGGGTSAVSLDTANQVAAGNVDQNTEEGVYAFKLSTDTGTAIVDQINLTWGSSNQAVYNSDVLSAKLYEDRGVLGTYEPGLDTYITYFIYDMAAYFNINSLGDVIGTTGKNYIVTLDILSGATVGNNVVMALEASDHSTNPGITLSGLDTVNTFARNSGNTRTIATPGAVSLDTTNQVAAGDVTKGEKEGVYAFKLSTDVGSAVVRQVNLTWGTGNQAVYEADVATIKLYEDKGTLGTFEDGTDTVRASFSYSAPYITIGDLGDVVGTAGKNYIVALDILSGATIDRNIVLAMEASNHSTNPGITVDAPDSVNVFASTDGNSHNITGSALPPDWWDANYLSRRSLTVDDAPAGYAVLLHYDATTNPTAATMYSNSLSSTPGDDFRVVYDGTEIDRHVDSFSSSNIDIWFKVQATITGGGDSYNYKLYYKNSSAANPPANTVNVYGTGMTFVAHYDNSSPYGVDGETPSTDSGTSYSTGVRVQGAIEINSDNDDLRYSTTDLFGTTAPTAGTIEFWFKPVGWNWKSASNTYYFFDATNNRNFYFIGTKDQFECQIYASNGRRYRIRYNVPSGWTDSVAHHFALSWDLSAGDSYLYIDGAQVAMYSDQSGSGETLNSDLRIGNRLNDGNPAEGMFDEFKVFNYAKTASQTSYYDPEPGATTPTVPPDTPTPTSPIDGATDQSTTPMLIASAFTGSSGSHQDSQFQVCLNSTCTGSGDPQLDYTAGTAVISWEVSSALDSSTTYFWRVRYQDDNDQWSPQWSAMTGTPRGEFVTIAPPPDTPTPTSPVNGVNDQSTTPTLQASAFSGGSGTQQASEWEVCPSSACSSPEATEAAGAVTSHNWTTTLNESTTYWWRVRYRSAPAGQWSNWSATTGGTTSEFDTVGPPATPTPTSPVNGVNDQSTTPTLQASAYSHPKSSTFTASEWEVCPSSACSSPEATEAAGAVTSHNWTTTLNESTTYWWRVRYRSAPAGQWSNWSATTGGTTSEFATASAAPSWTSPDDADVYCGGDKTYNATDGDTGSQWEHDAGGCCSEIHYIEFPLTGDSGTMTKIRVWSGDDTIDWKVIVNGVEVISSWNLTGQGWQESASFSQAFDSSSKIRFESNSAFRRVRKNMFEVEYTK